jgi:hypothetical protein
MNDDIYSIQHYYQNLQNFQDNPQYVPLQTCIDKFARVTTQFRYCRVQIQEDSKRVHIITVLNIETLVRWIQAIFAIPLSRIYEQQCTCPKDFHEVKHEMIHTLPTPLTFTSPLPFYSHTQIAPGITPTNNVYTIIPPDQLSKP